MKSRMGWKTGMRAARHQAIRRKLRDKLLRVVQQALAEEREHTRAENDRAAGRVLDELRNIEIRDRRDLFAAGEREAVVTSARFARQHMPTVPTFGHPHETLRYALTLAPTSGLALEFGVATGTTLSIIAEQRDQTVYGFDTFDGLPHSWRSGFPAGAFAVEQLPEVPGTELEPGLFEHTLPSFLAQTPGTVAFAHIDSDLYDSAVTVLKHIGPRLAAGSVLVFDEYFNYPDWQDGGEYRAWTEFCRDTGTRFEYAGYTLDNEQVIARVTG